MNLKICPFSAKFRTKPNVKRLTRKCNAIERKEGINISGGQCKREGETEREGSTGGIVMVKSSAKFA